MVKELDMQIIPSSYDPETGLFELIKTIWDGKLWLVIASLVTTSVGATYTVVVPTVYQIEVYATAHADADADADVKLLTEVAHRSKFGWKINADEKTFTLETQEPQNTAVYLEDLENARSITTIQLIKFKKDELLRISDLKPALLGTETIAATLLANQRFLYSFEKIELEIVRFSEPEIRVKSPKTTQIVVLSFIFGGLIGVLSVLIRSAYRFQTQKHLDD